MRKKHWLAWGCALAFVACGGGTTKKKRDSGADETGGTGGTSSGGSTGRAGTGGSTSNGGTGGTTNNGGAGGRAGSGGGAGVGAGGAAGSAGGAGGTVVRDGGADVRVSDGGSVGGAGGIAGKVTCPAMTNANFNIQMMGGFEELKFGPDGTAYWSNFNQNIGRWMPPYDKPPEKTWAKMPGGILGLTIDPKRRLAFAGARDTKALYRFSLDDPSKVDKIADVEGGFNGTTLGEDEAVYYTDQTGGHVYRVTSDGMKTKVTATPLNQPNDIAFNPDGALCINEYINPAVVVCFKLDATHMEMMGTRTEQKMGPGNGDGIAYDKNGTLYATGGGVWKLVKGTTTPVQVSPAGGNALEFGVGAISCQALFTGGPRMIMTDTPGMDVPWHRAP
jgi:sugar lactone lactonase YvrE